MGILLINPLMAKTDEGSTDGKSGGKETDEGSTDGKSGGN